MDTASRQSRKVWAGGVFTAAAVLCLVGVPALAQESTEDTSPPALRLALSPGVTLLSSGLPSVTDDRPTAGQGLRLRLDQPISLEQFGQQILGQGGDRRLAGTSLNYRLDDRLNLHGGMALAETPGTFHALGSIHCHDGVLDAMSYRAADCTFVDEEGGSSMRSIVLGAGYDLSDRASASVSLFQESLTYTQTYAPGIDARGAASFLDPFRRGGLASGGWLGEGMSTVLGAQGTELERRGVDLQFQVGFSTDQAGDLVLGLQLTRVLDSGTEGVFYTNPGARNWTIAKAYDTARLSLDWSRGSFSGGLDSYYRSPVSFLDQGGLDPQATFDVHFTWRAPWNASVSVGASNVLGASGEDTPTTDTGLADPLESIYGRIPYVRYKQDL